MSVRVRVDDTRLPRYQALASRLVEQKAASALARGDATLWGPEATPEASIRLGWIADPALMLPLVDEVSVLREQLATHGVNRIVLCGMGGSSLAPEVMAAQSGVNLEILDSTHPDHVAQVLSGPLEATAVVVASKSGTTVETATARASFAEAFRAVGLNPSERIIIVTDPDSPLHREAESTGHRVFLADATVGGRFSALTAFGLVPTGLAGVDTRAIIRAAHEAWQAFHTDDPSNPALCLAAALSDTDRDIAVLAPSPDLPGFGDWVEQLVAESTGKNGVGVLPVVTHDPAAPELTEGLHDVVVVDLAGADLPGSDVSIQAELGPAFLLWEYATALAGVLVQLNPFDQPDVESAKVAALGLLEQMPKRPEPAEKTADYLMWSDGQSTLEGAWSSIREALGDSGYLALQIYGNRLELDSLPQLRRELASALARPVTLGFGPRFLHSTGQFHKGGTPDGVFLQIEIEPGEDLAIPSYPYTFGTLIDAQSWGDRQVLLERGRPVLTVRVPNVQAMSRVLGRLLEWM